MGKQREALSVTEAGGGGNSGVRLSRWGLCGAAAVFVAALCLVALLVYTLVPCGLPPPPPPTPRLHSPRPSGIRLPRAILPHSYTLSLVPYIWPANFTFNGTVSILVNVTAPSTNMTLHASQLNIYETTVLALAPQGQLLPVEISSTKLDSERDFFILFFNEPLKKGQYKIDIRYSGYLNDELQGFYRSSYKVNTTTRWIATTQFQSTYARKAFPCFDEPFFKARFKISIARPANMTSISNMPKMGTSNPMKEMEGYEWDHFAESVPMSTYLVAFTVSDFDHLSDGRFTVWARSGAIEQARYALDIGPKILNHFEQYFQIPYPLPKTDMIALPDFAAGAMENWGLITYRETAMLYDERVAMMKQKQRVAMVISHELAHQWFGNLVTPAWWSDLWLNEGFATYVECLGIDEVEPSLRTQDQFVVNDLHNVLQSDAYRSSHPVYASVTHPSEIEEIFDSISYEKGASLIRMMEHFLTTMVFKRGLTNYLKSKEYQVATQDDLWVALTQQAKTDLVFDSGFHVKEIMESWTLKTGFPLITVTRNYEDGSAIVSQRRFHYANMSLIGGSKWWVPLSFTTQSKMDFNSTKPSHWMKAEEMIMINNLGSLANNWVIFNIKQTGFYRVNYDFKNWKMLTDHLNDPEKYTEIGELNRAQLIDDSFNLARAGVVNYSLPLNLTQYLYHESAYIPWNAALPGFFYIDSMINKKPIFNKFKKMVLDMLSHIYEEAGFKESSSSKDPLTVYKGVASVKWACYLGHEDCVRRAITLFQNWRGSPNPDNNNPISPNLKQPVYCTALREGGQADWEFAWQRYLNSNVGSEKGILLSALGCSRETWILSRYLHWAITEDSGIRKQDASSVFAAVSDNVIGHHLAFAFLRDNWSAIKKYFGTAGFTINSILRATTNSMNSEFELNMLKDFSREHADDLITSTATIQQAIEHVEVNVNWMKNNYQQLQEWFQNLK